MIGGNMKKKGMTIGITELAIVFIILLAFAAILFIVWKFTQGSHTLINSTNTRYIG